MRERKREREREREREPEGLTEIAALLNLGDFLLLRQFPAS
jgi:hypothetical protein